MSLGDSGVIGAAPAATVPAPAQTLVLDAPGLFPNLPLGQLPDDVAAFEPPAFALSRKEFEQHAPLSGGIPHGLPGGGRGEETVAASVSADLSPAFDGAHGVLTGAQQALTDAQGVLGGAHSALNDAQSALGNAPAALAAAQTALTQAAASLPALPALPADPVGDLMKGLALPAIPGMDVLFQPFQQLLNSFGTGVLGSFNPATLLGQGSKFIESAVSVGTGALKTVESLWQGQASQSAQSAGQQAQRHGEETTQRGFDLSALTEQAAAIVQRGNIELTAIAQSFVAQATALAPVILTPPAQTALIASATEHLASAITVVNTTRGELAAPTAQLNGIIGQLMGQSGGANPAEVAKSLAENVGQPILEQAKGLLESGLQSAAGTGTGAADGKPAGGDPDTKAAGLGGGGGAGGGGAGGGLGGGIGGLSAGTGGPGSSIPGGKAAAGPANPFGSGLPGMAAAGAAAGSGFMGSPAAAGAGRGGGSDAEHSRSVQPYQNVSGESELTGNLGAAAPGVIGQADEESTGDYDSGQA
ncbi:hypothetical protein LTV02_06375 [Nocardia yamanashiensis]|uniref:hypothetical protein n=1 Tax=Nocardia yamanashiensis TaxID=209247 RepID=UPI001E5CA6C9|nr:hypothetical protein [Nocardia yamanashiensis]UGT43017.1 hypothetical protein LTV02_06375 [Nocardia yamanashiensis]